MIWSGKTFLGGPDPTKKHLYAVLTEPDPTGHVVLVNITTHNPSKDETVILAPGDHPFIEHPSSVFYTKATISPVDAVQKGIDTGLLVEREMIAPELVNRIRRGALDSPFTPRKVKSVLRDLE